jgi:hypothetical protein
LGGHTFNNVSTHQKRKLFRQKVTKVNQQRSCIWTASEHQNLKNKKIKKYSIM